MQEVVDYVIRIDNDETLYQEMINAPVFIGEYPTLDGLERFLVHIVEQPLSEARRRPNNNRIKEAEAHAKVIAYYDKLIGMPLKHTRGLLRRLKSKSV